jgi:hypothetical protein
VEFFEFCAARLNPGGLVCTWSPTPRVYASFRRVFPYVLEADAGEILVGSLAPIVVDREAWMVRLEAGSRAYLGDENARDVRERIMRIRPAFHDARARGQTNLDLVPRDEFPSPALGPGSP